MHLVPSEPVKGNLLWTVTPSPRSKLLPLFIFGDGVTTSATCLNRLCSYHGVEARKTLRGRWARKVTRSEVALLLHLQGGEPPLQALHGVSSPRHPGLAGSRTFSLGKHSHRYAESSCLRLQPSSEHDTYMDGPSMVEVIDDPGIWAVACF